MANSNTQPNRMWLNLPDLDGDHIPDVDDPDVDGDGTLNEADLDDDNDSLLDTTEGPAGTNPFDSDSDDDDIIDGLDRDPLSATNNLCMGMGDDVTFSMNVADVFTCAAVNSITVEFGAAADVAGDLLFIAPTLNMKEMTVKIGASEGDFKRSHRTDAIAIIKP